MKSTLLPLLALSLLLSPRIAHSRSLQQQVIKIAPYGNSITEAAGDHDSYRYPLWKKLIDAGIPFDFVGSMNTNYNNVTRNYADYQGQSFDRDHEGHWGWRADELLEGRNNTGNDKMDTWLSQYTPDMVLLHIGTNDCIQGQDNNQTLGEIRQIIAKLRNDNPEVVIFLANLIPCGIAGGINDMNSKIQTLPEELSTDASPVIFVDQFNGFISGGDQYDGIHPNPGGEEKMAQKWFDAIDTYLNDLVVVEDTTLTIAPYGNSITQAYNNQQSYRYPLWKKLIDAEIDFDFVGSMNTNFSGNPSRPDYKGIPFDMDHEGHWGWRADELLNKSGDNMGIWLNNYTPDMVLLHIGTNDCIQNQDNTSTLNEIRQIVAKLRDDNPDVVIFLSNLIPCNESAATSQRVIDFNSRITGLPEELMTDASPVIFVDQNSGITAGDLYDGIHPGPAGEEKMAQKWFDAINGYLTSTRLGKNVAATSAPRSGNVPVHRISVLGLQPSTDKTALVSAKGVITNLLGKTVTPNLAPTRKTGGVYIIRKRNPEEVPVQ